MVETLACKKNRIETAVRDITKKGFATEAQVRTVLYAMDCAGYEFAPKEVSRSMGVLSEGAAMEAGNPVAMSGPRSSSLRGTNRQSVEP